MKRSQTITNSKVESIDRRDDLDLFIGQTRKSGNHVRHGCQRRGQPAGNGSVIDKDNDVSLNTDEIKTSVCWWDDHTVS